MRHDATGRLVRTQYGSDRVKLGIVYAQDAMGNQFLEVVYVHATGTTRIAKESRSGRPLTFHTVGSVMMWLRANAADTLRRYQG